MTDTPQPAAGGDLLATILNYVTHHTRRGRNGAYIHDPVAFATGLAVVIRRATPPTQGEGVYVPHEPTEAMVRAGNFIPAEFDDAGFVNNAASIYRAMLSAAPPQPVPQQPGGTREDVARLVYDAMRWAAQNAEKGEPPAWVAYGNSHAQGEARRVADRIAALSSQPEERGGWRLIESAPKDGTVVLLFCPRGDGSEGSTYRLTCGHWDEEPGGTTEYRDADGRYIGQDDRDAWAGWISFDGGFSEETMLPTHWKPLPPPPVALTPASTGSGEKSNTSAERVKEMAKNEHEAGQVAEQPVAWRWRYKGSGWVYGDHMPAWATSDDCDEIVQPLFTHPAKTVGREEIAEAVFFNSEDRFERASECYPAADAILNLLNQKEGK
jgi:hypothetical protein